MRSTPLKLQEFSARSTSRPEPKPARSDLSTSLTLAAMSLGYGVVQLDVTIVNTALDSIGTSLGGGVSELQWVVSSYTIAFRRLHSDRRRAGRSDRCQANLHGGGFHLHGGLGPLRAFG